MSSDETCSYCDRRYYDCLDADEMEKVDEADEREKYCCSEKGYPDPTCAERHIHKLEILARAAKKLIDMTFPKCESEGCKEFATTVDGKALDTGAHVCDQHSALLPEEARKYDMNYAEALREYLIAQEKNG
jgi:hypothetical protein